MIKLKLRGNICSKCNSSNGSGADAKLRSDVEQIVKDFSDICTNLYESQENFFNMQQVTYSELVELRDNGELVSGKYYRIINYETIVSHSECRTTGHQFDIIVKALNENKLYEEACVAKHEGDTYFSNAKLEAWKIWYSLDNDISRFDWADSVNGKGVIYRMIDEWNNDVPYDFKNIQFKRYKVSSKVAYSSYLSVIENQYVGVPEDPSERTMQGLDNDVNDFKWFYTFSNLNDGVLTDKSLVDGEKCCNNKIGYYINNYNEGIQCINNFVLAHGSDIIDICQDVCGEDYQEDEINNISFNDFGSLSGYSTIFGGCNLVKSYSQFRSCIMIGEFDHSSLNYYFQSNTIISADFGLNEVLASSFCHNVIVCNKVKRNVFGSHFDNNIIKCEEFGSNRIGNSVNSNVISITGKFIYNEIQNSFRENEIISSSNFSYNRIGSYFSNNTINNGVGHLTTICGQIKNNVFDNIVLNCTISAMCEYIRIYNANSDAKFEGIDVKTIKGSQGSLLLLDNNSFFKTNETNNRRITIEEDINGNVVATWKNIGQTVGVYKAPGANTWTNI